MLKNLELSTVSVSVPEAAFGPEVKLEVPEGAFDAEKKKWPRRYFPAYIKRMRVVEPKNGKNYDYAQFVFTHNFLKETFKGHEFKRRYELVQGKAPHQHWFMLRPTTDGSGNAASEGGVQFNTKYFQNIEEGVPFKLECVKKDGRVFLVAPAELVPLVRKG